MDRFIPVMLECPLFEGMSREDIAGILTCMKAKTLMVRRGGAILSVGEPATRLGVVLSGAAQVMRMDYGGNRHIMAHLQAGELFAEAFACAGTKVMPVDVIAAEDTHVLLIDAFRVTQTCAGACGFHQRMIYNLMQILARKSLMYNQKLDIFSRRTTREKLLTYLTQQARAAGSRRFTVPFDRQALADYLAVDRSGLSAEISKLRREGVLRSEKSRFELLSGAFEGVGSAMDD